MRIFSVALAVAAVAVATLGLTTQAQNSVQTVNLSEEKFALHLGPPSAPAHLSPDQALQVAESGMDQSVFTQHPHTIQYGAYRSRLLSRTATGLVPVGTRDVWAITISGLDVPRPAAEVVSGNGTFKVEVPPNIHTEVILVDDKSGKYLEAIDY